jgi:hypothetical protein
MTKIIHAVPLSCVWMSTGNPRHPLVCKWIPRSDSSPDLGTAAADEWEQYQYCA